MKHSDEKSLETFIQTLRQNRSPREVALHLRRNLVMLQERGLISRMELDEADLMALASRVSSDNDDPNQSQFGTDLDTEAYSHSTNDAPSFQQDLQEPMLTNPFLSRARAGFVSPDYSQTPTNEWTTGSLLSSTDVGDTEGFIQTPWMNYPLATSGLSTPFDDRSPVAPINTNPLSWYATQRQQQYQGHTNFYRSAGSNDPHFPSLQGTEPWLGQNFPMENSSTVSDYNPTLTDPELMHSQQLPPNPLHHPHRFQQDTARRQSATTLAPTEQSPQGEVQQISHSQAHEEDLCTPQ